MVEQLDLVGETIGRAGDKLQRHYTPQALADQLVQVVREWHPYLETVVEPSVGGGAFARAARVAWPEARLIGVDLDPRATGLAHVDEAHVGDWPTVSRRLKVDSRFTLVLGNPPFACRSDAQREQLGTHIHAALDLTGVVAFILPVGLLFPDVMAPIMQSRRPRVVYAITPRPWELVRAVGLFVWSRGAPAGRRTEVDHLPRWKP